MSGYIKYIVAGVFGACLMAAGSANATLLSTWDFTGPANGETSSEPIHEHANPATFTSTNGLSELNAYGYSVTREQQFLAPCPGGFRGIGCRIFRGIFGLPISGQLEIIGEVTEAGITHKGSLFGLPAGIGVDGEVDNHGETIEFIVLELPTDDWELVEIVISLADPSDDFQIFAASDVGVDDPGTISNDLTDFAPEIISDDGPFFPPFTRTLDLTGLGTAQYLIIVGDPFDFGGNDDFAIASFTGTVNASEPSVLALIGLGLVGLAIARRRRGASA